ncbi:MAG: hypothetical protein CVV27_13100 [Candidatus Melainabacteria bacterium HGW-Melainabacteria-1]|nr:MAG: hypothetical protein CVV27_13100 [Candidatus Melainabacteria bacterium HGW-Melainabacteria-1]
MLELEYFLERKLLLGRRQFFAPEFCTQLIGEMNSQPGVDASVYKGSGKQQSPERKTRLQRVMPESYFQIQQHIKALYPDFEAFFQVQPSGMETMQFLKYEAGHYFKPHSDASVPEGHAKRRITFVVFLNTQLSESEQHTQGFRGGSLVFYGPSRPGQSQVGLPLRCEQGMLVAFHPAIIHEVRPVEWGQRYTVIGWLI